MRSVKETNAYKKDFKRESRGIYRAVMAEELPDVICKLAGDVKLPDKYRGHNLTGEWLDHSECHIRPDFLLIYEKRGNNELFLSRLGSHAELLGL
ncbi:MAG: type II toxin-antitoxin system YafQ family toxin [Synergistaceae bacterium]|jgi:mRNA interferase YafQ|nr:type II toxin-antitoxin system YafQ family toxin [Synergistaceae bacterium]